MTARRTDSRTVQARRAVRFGREPLAFLDDLRGPGPALVDAGVGVGPTLTFVADPALVRQVLVADDDRYRRPDIQSERTIQLTQNGLIESEGPLWETQRRRLIRLFAPDQLADYADRIGTVLADVTADWTPGDERDLYEAMAAITVRVISRTLFSRPLSDAETARFTAANATIGREFEVSPMTLLRQVTPTPPSREYREAVAELHDVTIHRHRPTRGQPSAPASSSPQEPTPTHRRPSCPSAMPTVMGAADRQYRGGLCLDIYPFGGSSVAFRQSHASMPNESKAPTTPNPTPTVSRRLQAPA